MKATSSPTYTSNFVLKILGVEVVEDALMEEIKNYLTMEHNADKIGAKFTAGCHEGVECDFLGK